MAIQTGSTYISDSMTDVTVIPTANLGFLHAQREKNDPGRLRRRPTTGNGNMATKTENTYISGTMTDRITIPTVNLRF